MNEYEVTLANGWTTTMQLSDDDAKVYGKAAKKIGPVEASKRIAPEPVEVAADVERPAPRSSRGGSKETR